MSANQRWLDLGDGRLQAEAGCKRTWGTEGFKQTFIGLQRKMNLTPDTFETETLAKHKRKGFLEEALPLARCHLRPSILQAAAEP